MGKTYTVKTPPGDFKVTTFKNSLLSQQVVTSKGIPVLYTYSWTLTPIPNWTCSIVTISYFHCTAPSTWLTNCADPSKWLQSPTREGCWLQISSVHHTMKIKKLLDHKILWCTNTAVSSIERWIRTNSVSGHNLHEQNFASHLCNCVTFYGPPNNPYICLGLWEKKA